MLTVRNLFEDYKSPAGLNEKLMNGDCVALSARTGNKLFDTKINTKSYIEKFFDREVFSIWSDVVSVCDGYHPLFRPITKIYIEDSEGRTK